MEIWKDIIGFEGRYKVSSSGRIMSFTRQRSGGVILNGSKDKDGYPQIGLITSDLQKKYFRIHRLVAIAFIKTQNNNLQINHKNGVRDDNRVENLEWVTCAQNVQHSFLILGRKASWEGKRRGRDLDVSKSKKVAQMDKNTGEVIKIWDRIMDAGRAGFLESKISLVCNGKRNTSSGFKWKFI